MISVGIHRSDVPALVQLHMRAFPGFFLSQLGAPFLRQMYLGFIDDPDAVAVVGRDDVGKPVGVALGTVRPEAFFSRLLRRRLFGFGMASLLVSLRDPRRIPRLLRAIRYRGDTPSGHDGALLSSICIDPDAGRRHFGAHILAAWQDEVARRGSERAYLLTDAIDNDRVNRFYERCGWILRDTMVTPEGRRLNRYQIDLAQPPRGADDE